MVSKKGRDCNDLLVAYTLGNRIYEYVGLMLLWSCGILTWISGRKEDSKLSWSSLAIQLLDAYPTL